ncbi:MAG: PRC-barrel domain-containing protein [Paracoccaceae bacterium]
MSIAQNPTPHPMISTTDVNGADVYDYDGAHIGDIDHLMIDKKTGRIAYAVIGFGGFLGLGEEHYPVPWQSLQYDPSKGGYLVNVTKEQLESAPPRRENWAGDRSWEEKTHTHFGAPYYWMI